ncbi:MAG: hypothetical protein JNK63_10250 [Chthonomonas sp.]|nr:hypothetical protein [Chthonomonas sp.]
MASAESPSRLKRLRNIDAGAAAGKAWLETLFRSGIGAKKALSGFKEIEQRMVDSQAAGFARRFWLLAETIDSSDHWQDRFVAEAGLLYLLLESFERRDSLPELLREEVLRTAGITVDRRQLGQLHGITDTWDLAVQRNFREQRFFVRQSWLWGREARQWICLQQYRIATQEFDTNYALGAAYTGTVALYPGSAQTRATFLSQEYTAFATPPAATFGDLATRWAELLARFPWAEGLGGGVAIQSLSRDDNRWLAQDDEGNWFPIDASMGWRVAAYLGSPEMVLFGEWNGDRFMPTAVSTDGGFFPL